MHALMYTKSERHRAVAKCINIVRRTKGELMVTQERYTFDILQCVDMVMCKAFNTLYLLGKTLHH